VISLIKWQAEKSSQHDPSQFMLGNELKMNDKKNAFFFNISLLSKTGFLLQNRLKNKNT